MTIRFASGIARRISPRVSLRKFEDTETPNIWHWHLGTFWITPLMVPWYGWITGFLFYFLLSTPHLRFIHNPNPKPHTLHFEEMRWCYCLWAVPKTPSWCLDETKFDLGLSPFFMICIVRRYLRPCRWNVRTLFRPFLCHGTRCTENYAFALRSNFYVQKTVVAVRMRGT